MSPILVRPVREQLEHDRIIRLLQAKYRRRYETGINPGNEQNVGIGTGPSALYPDLVLSSPERGHRLQAVVEVETGESVNHLEALAEWAHFARMRAGFHLYVPSGMVDVARQLCEDNQIQASEIWSYHTIGDEVRFALVHKTRTELPPPPPRPSAVAVGVRKSVGAAKKARAAKRPARGAARPARAAASKASKAGKPARAQKRK